ncbi:MAG: hypothetical protein PWQ59_225 [Thermoanaerobacterium sp.]|jgi:hypothetical protein|nr:hypothetical protein [Thermoanaerobacterium sp.]MDK2811797.1 hypothetical protein [Petrotoga sp.]
MVLDFRTYEEVSDKIVQIFTKYSSFYQELVKELKNIINELDIDVQEKIKLLNYISYIVSQIIADELMSDFLIIEVEEIKNIN